MEDKEYQQFILNIKSYLGIDLGLYKESQMNRRMKTLFQKRGFNSYNDYYNAIKSNREILDEFLDRMTINVTEFFRNPNRWEVVKERVFPKLMEQGGEVKCWSAACSSGEEPYTIVMLLNQFMPLSKIQVLATDMDTLILERAKQGIYTEQAIKGCPSGFVDKYFIKDDKGLYRVKDEIKERVTFKKHNLLHDNFEKGFDFIVCRNVMIYFTEEAKDILYQKFNASLNQGGVFFVGSTEQIFHPEEYGFAIFDPFFYEKK